MKKIGIIWFCMISFAVLSHAQMEKQNLERPRVPYGKKRPEAFAPGTPERLEAEKFWADYRTKKRAYNDAVIESIRGERQRELLSDPQHGKVAREVAAATDRMGVVWVDKLSPESQAAYDRAALGSYAGKPMQPTALFKEIVGGTTGHDKEVFNAVQQVRSISQGRAYKMENMIKAVRGQIPSDAKISDEQISKLLSVPDVESLFEKWSSVSSK